MAQTSKMFIRQVPPQIVWVGHSPNEEPFAFPSQFDSCRPRALATGQIFYQGLHHISHNDPRIWSAVLSQPRPLRTMEDENWFDNMADRGDDPYLIEGTYNDCYSGIGLDAPNTRTQTTSAYVSAANAGRDLSPNHFQQNKESSGNEPMVWSSFPSTNAYPPHYLGANVDSRNHAPWQTYDAIGMNQLGSYPAFHDGLTGANWDPNNMPVLGEPLECDQISPATTYSSFSSSAASDAMGSLTLDSMNGRESVPRDSQMAHPGSWDCPPTISPKQLHINPSPTPNSSSESVHTALLAGDISDLNSSAFSQSHQRNLFASKASSNRNRRELPNKPTKSRHGQPASQAAYAQSSVDKSSMASQQNAHHHELTRRSKLAQLKPRPEGSALSEAPSGALPSQSTRRSEKDEFLIRSKESGMKYREIREKGGFKEAESTLRGRYRSLTKSKEARVRNPQWQENDLHLLRKAVHKLARGSDLSSAKIPWKEVAKYIVDHGGSYHFGNSTCRKRWDDLVAQGKEF
ncbi:hypothetical protein DL766_000269 [Monosporascus sp. MC13-8B]|uniref:Myb-like domain-containing protein n=1 Tax=Monosporascus cannonballus TaxID=155416 RepID=A0ABY0H0T1_9PEZI|nr:hypothetical protein DL763_008630 [Monosporascus cannonballus]RYO81563.1 hypothetical protein DL762_007054 [Monosporascus cannonballus]RYP39827.1 hypothetical protein DL766_000269 [Monosporascus sp. MC13-8B]